MLLGKGGHAGSTFASVGIILAAGSWDSAFIMELQSYRRR